MARALAAAGIAASCLTGAVAQPHLPLRTNEGQPLCAVCFFTHWWEPWRSQDGAILADLSRLRAGGINTLLVDHEWSQAIDGNWRLLDRGHRLARESGMGIVPWLSLKSWSDIAAGSSPSDGDQPVRISHDLVVVLEGREWAYL